ncbi:hypothetical protein KIN20_024679 [Parelaphostrongylus tenuis]|uniref:Uncharacterized protein n=1 Tax=Parelaphostrongylus tenuis TaxID=148309 RepID=A0AAD5QWW4_PARTN|nr:hypothetical protein KIN20_024679 [Parelaphostrongylus tenuis]
MAAPTVTRSSDPRTGEGRRKGKHLSKKLYSNQYSSKETKVDPLWRKEDNGQVRMAGDSILVERQLFHSIHHISVMTGEASVERKTAECNLFMELTATHEEMLAEIRSAIKLDCLLISSGSCKTMD